MVWSRQRANQSNRLEPASSAVPAATENEQHDDDDDHQCRVVHAESSFGKRERAFSRQAVASIRFGQCCIPICFVGCLTGRWRSAVRGVDFKSLHDVWADTTTANNRLMLTVLSDLAELERDLIRARTGGGRKRAQVRGVRMTRSPRLGLSRQATEISSVVD
jgi:Resolvase, N terminal domain